MAVEHAFWLRHDADCDLLIDHDGFLIMLNAPPTLNKPLERSTQNKLILGYDIVMLLLIVLNLLSLGINALLMGNVGASLAHWVGQDQWLTHFQQYWSPVIRVVDDWFTVFLVVELVIRWLLAIVVQRYHRWFFFPFVHWYEVLGCIPAFRALRLLRAVAIGYRLYRMGYHVLPPAWIKQGQFYYQLILEEISDRIVINVLDGVERELRHSQTHHHLMHDLLNRHRDQIAAAVGEVLQASLAPVLASRTEQIQHEVGEAVHRALADVPELHRLLRLMPVVGAQLEQQLQLIGKRIGDNLTAELIKPFTAAPPIGQTVNPTLATIADHISDVEIELPALEALVESLVFEGLSTLKQQVAVQQWKQQLEAHDAKQNNA